MKKLFLIFPFLTLLLVSCSSMVDDMHRELDEGAGIRRQLPRSNKFDQFRNTKKDLRKRSGNLLSTSDRKKLIPGIKRKYKTAKNMGKRFNASDLNDNGNVGSLWSGFGNDSYLFTKDTEKQHGDIVVINVFKKFKSEISVELKRNFPDAPIDESDKKKKDEKAAAEKPKEPKEGEIIDRISTVVIEEINKDHLLVRGRKALLFKKRKRLVEIQALISRRDVADDDTVGSDKFLESSIHVLR